MLGRLKLYAGGSHPHAAQINHGARRAQQTAEAGAATESEEA